MKIGPIDIGIPALIYLGGSVALGIVCFTLWKSGEDVRYQAYYREKIMRGVSDGLPEAQALGVNAARDLLKLAPDNIPAQFYMANIHGMQGSYGEAKAVYDTLLKNPKLSPLEKAIANTTAGVCTFHLADKKEKAKAAVEAETYFKAAIEADSTYADAHAQLALVQPFKNPEDWQAAAAGPAKKALEAALPPTAETLENLYRLQGAILQSQKLPKESLAAIDAAQGVKPTSGKNMEGMRNATRLASIIEKDMPPDTRRKQIEDLERDMAKLGDRAQMARGSIAIGLGWMLLKDDPDWAEKGFPAAVRSFQRAIDQDPQNRLIYDNASALYEMRTEEVALTLTGTVSGFKGTTPPLPPAQGSARPKRFMEVDKPIIAELRRLQREQEELWKRFMDRAIPTQEERAEARLRTIVCMRRQAYTMDTDEENAAKVMLDRAFLMAKDVEAREPQNPAVAFAVGMLLLDMKRDTEAIQRFEKAYKLGYKSPLLDEVMASFGDKATLVAARPVDGQRWFGARPLVSATLRSPGAAEGFRGVEMKHNGKVIPGHMIGTQVLYYPIVESLVDGKHTIDISVTEAITMKKIDFPPLEFNIDKLPPTVKIHPENGDVKPAAQFNVTLIDPTGIDLTSVKITFKSTQQGGNAINRPIVSNGRYALASAADGIKMGANIPSESFKVAAGTPLPEGGYVMEIVVKDLTGNETRLNKGFIVTK